MNIYYLKNNNIYISIKILIAKRFTKDENICSGWVKVLNVVQRKRSTTSKFLSRAEVQLRWGWRMGNYPVNVPKPVYCTGPSLANFGYWCTSAGLTNDDGVTRLALYLAGLRGARCRREEMLFCLEASKRVISLHVLLTGLCSRALAVVSSLSLPSVSLYLSTHHLPSSPTSFYLLPFRKIWPITTQ